MVKVSANKTIISAKRRLFVSATALIAAGAFLNASNAQAVDEHADWDNVQIVEGQGTVTDTGLGSTTIDQHSMRAIGEAQELHIGTMGSVQINQNSKDALFVGRVIGNHSDPTQILGRLSADGRVMIIDRNGVFFGQDSVVDAAGIAVTTGDIANTDIMDGNENYTFENFGDGEIALEGTMNINDAGLAAFVAPNVRNSGVINAKMGKVVFAGGETATLDLYGDGLVEVAVDGALGNTLLQNTGTINAEGGSVVMTAQSARDVVDNVINNEGVINVSSVALEGGKIILSGGDKGKVSNTGTVDASGTKGGSVKITGEAVELGTSSQIKANATSGQAGKIEVLASKGLNVGGKLQAQGEGKSGFIETSAPDVAFAEGTDIKTGHWLLDPTSITVDAPLATIIEGQLSVGDAEITTPAAGAQLGLINFVSTIDWNTANTFTANAIDDIYFSGGGGLNATGGGHVVLNSGDDIRMFAGSTGIKTTGGNVTLNAFEEVALRGGPGIDAGGGNIVINNQTAGFYSFANSLTTTGTGTITLNQNQDQIENPDVTATIQNAIDAINNTGTGLNTIHVGEGVYEEQLQINHDNIALIGNPGDPTVPGANSATLLGSGFDGSVAMTVASGLSNVTISGFDIDNFDDGINATGSGGTLNINNNTFTAIDSAIRVFNWNDVDIGYNIFEVTNPVDVDPGAIFLSATTSNIHDNILSDTADVGLLGMSIFGTGTHTIVRNDIDGFGTGIKLGGGIDADIRNNFIRNNGTGVQSADGLTTIFDNDLSGNTTAINNTGGGTVDASGNWFGTTTEADVIAMTSGSVDVSPYLASGTDTDAGTLGFQGDFSTLYVTDEGAQTSGLINEAIGLVNPHGQIFVNDGLYTENVLINKSLKLTGLADATLNPEAPGEALVTVTASDVNIDPFIFDGKKLVNYGVLAKGNGTHNLTIDGNTFRNFKKGGIFLAWTSGGNINVVNNIIEGSMSHGIRTGTMQDGTYLNIANNTVGSALDPVNYIGIDVGRVRNSSVFVNNNTVYAGRGISQTYANNSNVEVAGNTVRSKYEALAFHGIENGSTVLVSGNDLESSDGTGVKVESGAINGTTLGASTLTIDNNTIAGNGHYGIDVYYGDLSGNSVLNITNNSSISGFYDGIYVGDSLFGGVTVNIGMNGEIIETPDGLVGVGGITSETDNGIALYGIAYANVYNNFIHDVGIDGVYIDQFDHTDITGNLIDTTGDDGIEALNGGSVYIFNNTIRNVGDSFVLPLLISSEEITEYNPWGADAIHVQNVDSVPLLFAALEEDVEPPHYYPVQIIENHIDTAVDDGIQVVYSGDAYIAGNDIANIGQFLVASSTDAEKSFICCYPSGSVDEWGADGIHVLTSGGASTAFAKEQIAYETPYYIGNKTDIISNVINNVQDDGIETEGVNDLLVDANTITNIGDDGITILGYGGYPIDPPVDIEEAKVSLAPVYYGPGYNAVVSNNTVDNTGGDGVESSGYDNLEVRDNNVSNTYFNGLYVSGFYNGYVSMQGNTFTDNGHIEGIEETLVGAGARFESGDIDMSDASRPNFFVNTRGVKALGMQFDPAEMYYYYTYGAESLAPESIVPVSLANLTIVNETLGTTNFTGYGPEGSFYVRFEDGAILDEFGNVILIDGTDATFDTINPASTGDIISLADLTFIEDRLWDADDPDIDGRGQIFVGTPADPIALDNIQDFFNQFENAGNRSNGLNVTFLGLPPLGPLTTPSLNNIAPAAGEGEGQEPNQNQPQNLADINPAAGNGTGGQTGQQQNPQAEQVGCWSDLSNALGSGRTASISDSGSPEDAMNAAINCGNQQI